MQLEQIDAVWLDAHHRFSIAELERCSGLSEAELRELEAQIGSLRAQLPRRTP